eukprot:gene10442-11361_t
MSLQPVIIVFGHSICDVHRILIGHAILQNERFSLKEVLSFRDFFETFKDNDLRNDLIIIVSHGVFSIGDSGYPSYFHGVDEVDVDYDALISLRDGAGHVWFAACMTSNIDVTFVDTKYNPDPNYIPKRLHSLVPNGDAGEEKFTPVISISWLVSFFFYMRNFSWWTCEGDPIKEFAEKELEKKSPPIREDLYPSELMKHIELTRNTIREKAEQWKRDDQILYPNHLSFPEIIHSAVFVALFPHKELKLLFGTEAEKKYEKDSPSRSKKREKEEWDFLSEELGTQGNSWFDLIRERSDTFEPKCGTISFTSKEICSFQLSLSLSRVKYFHKRASKSSSMVPNLDQLFRRLVCGVEPEPVTVALNTKFIALTIRPQSHENDLRNDWRVKCSDQTFLKFVEILLEKANSKDFGVVLMDGSHNKIDAIVRDLMKGKPKWGEKLIDLTSHYKSERRKEVLKHDDPSTNLFINQILFLRHCVVKYNICGAIGIHSGFLDLLNLLGVPINKTYRFFGEHQNTSKEKDDIAHWKSRTDEKFLKFFYSDQDTIWQDHGVPSEENIEDFLKKL